MATDDVPRPPDHPGPAPAICRGTARRWPRARTAAIGIVLAAYAWMAGAAAPFSTASLVLC